MPPLEWIGGRLSPPFYIRDSEDPYRPLLVVWMEAPTGIVVAQDVVAPEDVEGAVGRVLLAGLDQPLAGPQRQPDSIRVADELLVAEVEAAVGDTDRESSLRLPFSCGLGQGPHLVEGFSARTGSTRCPAPRQVVRSPVRPPCRIHEWSVASRYSSLIRVASES